MSNVVYLNGEYVAADKASVSVLDRGFMFGDGVYEVIPVYSGKTFAVQGHLNRLQRSLDAIEIKNPLETAEWQQIMDHLIEKNTPDQDAMIYLQLTRGVMQKRDHVFSRDMQSTILMMCQPLTFADQNINTPGIKAITQDDNRWADCFIKSINLLPNVLLKQTAADQNAVESILIRDGFAVEGSASNLFIVKDDIIRTPPVSRHMLGGITREVILQICNEHKIVAREIVITEDELHDADEIWITSSTKEIVPVTTLNQHKVGNGVPGPKWLQLIELYQQFKQSVMRA
ncbi:MAG: D-amino acid aminotransferase [Gammaproteobacteria bacterium]|jgi:D-alanine transaminase|nr:D-amino acid aminotransferase [Gammaproteobacteria bacterium]